VSIIKIAKLSVRKKRRNYFPYLAHLALDLRFLCDPFLLFFVSRYIYIVFIDLVFCVIFDARLFVKSVMFLFALRQL